MTKVHTIGVASLKPGDILSHPGDSHIRSYRVRSVDPVSQRIRFDSKRHTETDWSYLGEYTFAMSSIQDMCLKEPAMFKYDPNQQGDQDDCI